MKVRKNFCLIVLLSILFLLFIPNAIFASDTYTVTFDSNGGSAVDSILVDEGALITEPSAPTREGFTFAGWYKDQSFADDWDFEEDKTTSNTILYARWYKEGYNEYEYFRIQEILNFPSATAGKSNGQVLNTNYNSEDPQTWSVVWENTDSNRHILYINWMHPILYGDMDLSNFTALKEFTLFWENKVNSLNLSNDTALTRVSCETGTITSINLSNDIALVDFSCHHNKITSLDLSSNTILKYLDCSENQLTLLNVDNNPNLEEINCEKNNIGSLNLSNNNKLTELLCDDNKILSLDLSNNQDLFRLQCKDLTNITLNLYNSPVSITVMGKGSLSVDNDDDGWTWTVHANPSPACIFYNWTKNNVQISNLNEIEITSALNGEIYANFSDEIYYNVYFDTGESTTQTTVAINSLIQKPQNPQRTGYTFSTWSTAQFGGMIWDFNTNIVTCDMTLYAKWVINSYPVKFESNNGSHVNDIYAVYNTTIAEPEVPFRGGYNFDGWYKDSQLTQKWDFSTDKVTSMITLYAKWVLATYCTVSFECNGGSAKNSVSTKQYSIMSTPIPPTKTGYYFAGWFKDPELTQLWNFSTDIVTADMTLYANWSTERYTVNFECNGGSAVNDILASPNSTITSPDEPTKIGTYFVGWYKDPSLTQVWNFRTDIVTDSITLYAKWSIINYMVNFNSNGGSTVNYISTTYNTIITAPPPPTKAYYTFAGWYKESECTNLWNFDTDTVTHTITLYAKWVTADYIVSFNTNGGSTVESISTTYNSIISKPADPTYWGYVFGGWYKEPEFVNKWNFASDKVTVSITLYAKWIPINVNELQALRDFLNQPSAVAGKTNGQVLSSNYDQYYTNTWSSCFNWSIIDDEYYLTSISIANKQVSGTLNISGFSKLTSINCTSTGINSINVANNPLLYSVSCLYDDNLTALIVKDNPVLKKIQCQSGQISSLNAENNSCLDELNCSSNKLTSLNISNCNLLTILKCNYNMLTSLNVSENTELITLDCSNNKITSLNVSKMSSLAKLDCYNNQISNLDVSKNTLLTSLDCSGNLLTKLNIGVQENILTKLNYSDNKISTLNVSNCINLESLGCANNNLTSVNVSNNLKLKSLDCGYNPLTSLNLGNNTLLEGLRVSKTNLSKLDLSKLTALKVLYCEINNYLTSLDLSHNTNLTHLYCEFSELTSLDLSNNKLLKLVYCEHNHIRSLDFSNNPELTDL
ncbi:MAG: InlB B-repeat-containing protein, partial [Eubacteriaceae bacterium]